MKNHSKFLPLLAFCTLGVVWGSNFIYMKMASDLITPSQIVFLRILFGFLPVIIYALYRRSLRIEHIKYFGHFFVMAMLATAFYYYCFVKGTSLLFSGVAGAVSGAIPLFSFLLAVLFIEEEKCRTIKVIGILIGFAGVAIIGSPSATELAGANLEGVFYMAAGSLSVGASFVYAKKFIIPLKISATALTTYQLGLGLLVLALLTDYKGMNRIFTTVHTSVGLVVGLGLLGTGLAYIIYYYIVENSGAVAASSVTYIPPVVALLIGALFANEPIGLTDYCATALIFLGVFLLKGEGTRFSILLNRVRHKEQH
ncbi:DMT family transporter [Desulfopila aestuarii]|uniref:Permease of the drug/metabolite transporter (DMT) superfamily n=1 Tax=Desulfopila aestuarii DSM 18488 TaxID=1121416 RepID=A0A1M7YKW7_9BACT|nr:DMT family transporter [Desulfopila aestuarii]SHO53270.1 Permease of the drug/metabolite transporter (DMT) superfamily [Desulfopila aestuarii DSM 18488]